MAWDEHAKVEKSINDLHETTQKQTSATNKQSNIMIFLTVLLVLLTIALLSFTVWPIFNNNIQLDTKTTNQQKT
jgi:flagellar basal body-associated protein FliL